MVYVAYMQIFFCRSPAEIWIFMLSVVDWIVCLFSRSCHAMLCMSAAYAVMRCLSVCLSVCLSRSWVLSKRINVSSKFFHHRVAKPFSFFHTKRGGAIPTGTPLMGASNARGYEKIYDFRPISRCISETVIVRWTHAARQFVSIEFTFHPYNI